VRPGRACLDRDGHRPAPAAGLDEFQAVFHSSTRHVIERRRAELVLRDDGHDGRLRVLWLIPPGSQRRSRT